MESEKQHMGISVNRTTYTLIKEYCAKRALKISGWIEKLTLDEIYKKDDIEKGYDKFKNQK